jgi:hypothetical protein
MSLLEVGRFFCTVTRAPRPGSRANSGVRYQYDEFRPGLLEPWSFGIVPDLTDAEGQGSHTSSGSWKSGRPIAAPFVLLNLLDPFLREPLFKVVPDGALHGRLG